MSDPKKSLFNTTSSKYEMMTYISYAMNTMEANVSKQTETLQQKTQAMQKMIV
jgi:hypothetical protein